MATENLLGCVPCSSLRASLLASKYVRSSSVILAWIIINGGIRLSIELLFSHIHKVVLKRAHARIALFLAGRFARRVMHPNGVRLAVATVKTG